MIVHVGCVHTTFFLTSDVLDELVHIFYYCNLGLGNILIGEVEESRCIILLVYGLG